MRRIERTIGNGLPFTRRLARGLTIVGVLALVMASGAKAEEPDVVTSGPGAVFDSLDAAAIDALKYAHRTLRLRNGQGGVIFATDAGFSYGPMVRATGKDGFRLTLRPGAVGWFYAHNYAQPTVGDRHLQVPTRRDRSMVGEVDPHHRPLYLLTSAMKVVRYDGRSVDVVWPRGKVTIEDVIAAN